ncbi:BEL1-like homeodomain protein 9 [Cornus florida]|uniref:BEL1-like homeodomain protein 9 n=1 Tax=Cornus florida TaxID=4283 RepID=UPI0028A0236E|nr:BEL1-like homeodomain protein 9 [Cornus florida]
MAERFEPYHVPQQSRREKLREVVQNHPRCAEHLQECTGYPPLYDPSDLLTCTSLPNQTTSSSSCGVVKGEGVNLMGYVGNFFNVASSSSASTSHHLYMDPQSSIHINPNSIQDSMSNNPFLYTPQNLRVLDQSFHGGEIVVSKPEALLMTHESVSTNGQGLSLSLSSHHTNQSKLPLKMIPQRYESSMLNEKLTPGCGYNFPATICGGGLSSNDISRPSSVPLGPFTGYASILKGSRFLKPAEQLLEDFCDVGRGIYAEKISVDSSLVDSSLESLSGTGIADDWHSFEDEGEHRRKKSRLISLLDEVYKRCKHYCQQMQAVVASFESVAGLGNAAPFVNLALKAMFKHFRCLKDAITDQLQFTRKAHGHVGYRKDETTRFGNSNIGLYSPRTVHNLGSLEQQPVWRPQRGLPERAVSVLRAWLFEHFLHPYPTDTDKLMLAKQTGLSRSQVSNWFINARVRLWKPMVEEIHSLETRQDQKASQREEQLVDRPSDHLPTANLCASGNPCTSIQRAEDLSSSCTRTEFLDAPMESEEPMHLSYDNLLRHPHVSVGLSSAGGSSGVSLTLGLHQNNGIGLSEHSPISAAHQFSLDANNERYITGNLGAQNQRFGRDIIGGQHFHDFVG